MVVGCQGRGSRGWQGVSGHGDQEDWGGAGGVSTLVLGGPISKGVYSGGAPPGLETPSPKGALMKF